MAEEELQTSSVPLPPEEELGEEFLAEKIPVGWPWRLLLISFVILGLAILIYVGLLFGYEPYLKTSISNVDKQISNLADKVKVEDQEKLLTFYSQVVNLKDVLDNRVFSSKVFPFLERNTDPSIYFTAAEFSGNNNILRLKGTTSNFENLMAQLTILKQAPEIESVVLNDTNLSKNRIDFEATVIFRSNYFNGLNQ